MPMSKSHDNLFKYRVTIERAKEGHKVSVRFLRDFLKEKSQTMPVDVLIALSEVQAECQAKYIRSQEEMN